MKTSVLLTVIAGILLASPAFAQSDSCDRACLESTVDRFLDAFIKHDPSMAPLTRTVRFTENGQRLTVGDGSWRSMIGKGTYRLFVSDPRAGQVAFIGTLREENQQNKDGAPVLIALRLKGMLDRFANVGGEPALGSTHQSQLHNDTLTGPNGLHIGK